MKKTFLVLFRNIPEDPAFSTGVRPLKYRGLTKGYKINLI